MSSVPFKLGLPVVDQIPAESGIYVVRSKNFNEFCTKIKDLRDRLTDKDIVKGYYMGYRPDHPVPNAKYFVEVQVRIGEAEVWMKWLDTIVDYYNFTVVGNRKTQEKE